MGINCNRDSNLISEIQLDARNSKEGSKIVENRSTENVRPPRFFSTPNTPEEKKIGNLRFFSGERAGW